MILPPLPRMDKHNNKEKIIDIDNTGEKLKHKFVGRDYEAVVLLLLDSKYKEVFCGVVSKGSVSACEVYVRKVIELAVLYNAKFAVLAHNHPSGLALPSNADPTVELTGGSGNEPYNFDFGLPSAPASTVSTVNGQSGDVVLTASDIGLGNVDNVQQYSATNPPPYPVTSVNGMTGDVIVQGGGGGSDVLSVNGQSGVVVLDKDDIGLSNVANVAQYSASNPPPYPVTSVNGMTGDVVVSGGGGTVGTKQTVNIISLYSSEITVQSAYKVVIGDMITYIVKFRNSKSSNLNIPILSGFEKPMTSGSDQGAGVILVNDEKIYHAVISSQGTFRIPSNAGIPLGDFTAITTYIKQ